MYTIFLKRMNLKYYMQIFFFIILHQNNQKQSVYTITLQIAKHTIVLDFG
jgi:hypothetical protein